MPLRERASVCVEHTLSVRRAEPLSLSPTPTQALGSARLARRRARLPARTAVLGRCVPCAILQVLSFADQLPQQRDIRFGVPCRSHRVHHGPWKGGLALATGARTCVVPRTTAACHILVAPEPVILREAQRRSAAAAAARQCRTAEAS